MKLAHVFSIALLASCQAVPLSFQVMNARNGPIPPVNEDLTISMGDHELYSLTALLSNAVESSGLQVFMDSDVRSRLSQSGIGFRGDFTVPADEVWTVTELALLEKGFFLSTLYMGETEVITVHRTDRNQMLGSDLEFLEVDVEDLDYLAVHPGFLFSLRLELPNTGSHTAQGQVRGRAFHGVDMRCTVVGDNAVLLEGLGIGVEKIARELLETDESNWRQLVRQLRVMEERAAVRQPANSKGAIAG